MWCKLSNLRTLTIAKLTDDKDTGVFFNDVHTDNSIIWTQTDTTDTTTDTAHRSNIFFMEADGLPLTRRDNYFVLTTSHTNPLQLISIIKVNSNQPVTT